jgi:hypothetical protein
MTRRRTVLVLVAALSLGACASNSSGNSSSRQRDLITAAEIAELNVATAFDVVRQLRPEFLRSRGTSSREH